MLFSSKIRKGKTFKIIVALSIFAIAFGAGFYANEQINKKKIASLKNELSLTRTDLEFANRDQPRVLETRTETYPVKDLPIYSDHFEGKEVEINDLLLKGTNLKEYIIYIDKKDLAFPTRVTVWDYKSENVDRFNHRYLVDKLRIVKGVEYVSPDNKDIYNAKSGFAWNKPYPQKLSRLHESTSNHAIFVEVEDTNVILGDTYWDGSVPENLQTIVDSIGFN